MKSTVRVTTAALAKEYARINGRFFQACLPVGANVHFGNLDEYDADAIQEGDEITLANHLKYSYGLAVICLMHEMVHLHLGPEYRGVGEDPDHGMRFQAELVRLFNAGAYDGLL